MKKAISPQAAAERIPDGARIMIGGFMGLVGLHRIIDALIASSRKSFELIAKNRDAGQGPSTALQVSG